MVQKSLNICSYTVLISYFCKIMIKSAVTPVAGASRKTGLILTLPHVKAKLGFHKRQGQGSKMHSIQYVSRGRMRVTQHTIIHRWGIVETRLYRTISALRCSSHTMNSDEMRASQCTYSGEDWRVLQSTESKV